MTLNEFLKYVETRKPLKGDEIHQFMNKMSDEARRMTFELNGSYHAPEAVSYTHLKSRNIPGH